MSRCQQPVNRMAPISESLRNARAIVTTIALVVLLVMAVGSPEVVGAPMEMAQPSAAIDSHAHVHDDSPGLSWTRHGQSHDPSGHDHGAEVLAQQSLQSSSLCASADLAVAGPPVYCAPIFEVESPPRV